MLDMAHITVRKVRTLLMISVAIDVSLVLSSFGASWRAASSVIHVDDPDHGCAPWRTGQQRKINRQPAPHGIQASSRLL